jgi:hypothetical protein
MHFTLDDLSVYSPQIMLETCEAHGFDTSLWLGKANSFVDRRGAEPSCAYLLVDSETIDLADTVRDPIESGPSGGTTVTPKGSNKFTLKVHLDELDDQGDPIIRTYPNMYVDHYINITPSWDGNESFYLLKLVDARFIFGESEAAFTKHSTPSNRYNLDGGRWFNKVEVYLTPEQLKYEYELTEEPEFGEFIYDEDTISTRRKLIGVKDDGTEVRIGEPYTWEEVFEQFFFDFCDDKGNRKEFPWFDYSEFNFAHANVTFPDFVPQGLTYRYTEASVFLRRLLFWTNTSLVYDGEGGFVLEPIRNDQTSQSDGQGGNLSEVGVILQDLGNPSDKQFFNPVNIASNHVPYSLNLNMRLLDWDRTNNEKEEYGIIPMKLPQEVRGSNKRELEILIPHYYTLERDYTTGGTATPDERESELYDYYYANLAHEDTGFFRHFPQRDQDFTGYRDVEVGPLIERISFFDIGDGPYTRIESILPITDWEWLAPTPIIPRENKVSIILGKFVQHKDVDTFEFNDPKVLVGEGPNTGHFTAYNTFRNRDYEVGEEILLVKGYGVGWREKTALTDLQDGDTMWYTTDQVPHLRLKVSKDNVTGDSTTPSYTCAFDDIEVVNGRRPRTEEGTSNPTITIQNSPRVKLESEDGYLYFTYDITVGNNALEHWTTADMGNYFPILKALPNYKVVAETGKRFLSDGFRWEEASIDVENFEETVIQIVNDYLDENPPTGGSGVTILKGFVNDANGVASTDLTFNFNNATALVAAGNPTTAGSCDNTFSQSFVHAEPIMLILKSNGVWTGVKMSRNIILATVISATGVSSNEATFTCNGMLAVSGTAPTTSTVTVSNHAGEEFAQGDRLLLTQGNDSNWIVLRNTSPQAGIFRTGGTITGATYNTPAVELTLGTGTGARMQLKTGSQSVFEIGANVTLKNMMIGVTIAAGRIVQAKRVGKFWMIDVESCT